jgi:hypothetical protein
MPFPPGSSTPLGLASIWDRPDCRGIPCRLPKPRQAYCRQECAPIPPTGSKRDFASNRARPAWPLRRPVPGPAGINLEGQGPALLRESGDVKLERPKGQSSSSRTDGAALYSCLIPVARCKPRSRSAERVWRNPQIWPHGMRRICQSSLGECVSHQDVAVSVISLGAGTPKRGRSSKRTPTVKKTPQSTNSRFRFASWDPKSSIARNQKLPILDFHNATIKSQQLLLVECRNGNNVPVTRTDKVLE